jgi:1-deoxy-D-xylulose-5-phosphate reductoisomerase
MRLPIQHTLCYPERLESDESLRLDFLAAGQLTFTAPDRRRFPCLDLAYEAARKSGSAPCVLSAADEVAVGAFLNDKIDFTEIPGIIEKVLSTHRHVTNPGLAEIQSIHDWATEETRRLCKAL